MSSHFATSTSTEHRAWLSDTRWSSNTFHAKQDNYWLTIETLPGVLGGIFAAFVDGLQSDYHGTAQVTITSTIARSSRNHDGTRGATAATDYLEVESRDVEGPRIDFEFLIPFDVSCTSDGAHWTLTIEFANGVTELFEIPVYRTEDSDPDLTQIKIATIHSANLPAINKQSVTDNMPGYSLAAGDSFQLKLPVKVSGKPSLFPGLAIFSGLWLAVSVAFFFVLGTDAWFIFTPLPIMALLLVFLHQGSTTVEMNRDRLTIKHTLFGVSIPSGINRDEIAGFSTRCLGSMPSDNGSQAAYMLGVEKNSSGFKMLSPALLSQWDSRLLIKRLSEYWDISL